jgi:hypothetical protein
MEQIMNNNAPVGYSRHSSGCDSDLAQPRTLADTVFLREVNLAQHRYLKNAACLTRPVYNNLVKAFAVYLI